jgi:hypothetical protein
MDAENFIYETLINDAGVKAYTNSVTAMLIPQEVKGSAITFFRVSTEPFNTLCVEEAVSEFVTMQIDFWGSEYRKTISMYEAGRRALETTGKAELMNRHDEKDTENGYYRVITEFKIFI